MKVKRLMLTVTVLFLPLVLSALSCGLGADSDSSTEQELKATISVLQTQVAAGQLTAPPVPATSRAPPGQAEPSENEVRAVIDRYHTALQENDPETAWNCLVPWKEIRGALSHGFANQSELAAAMQRTIEEHGSLDSWSIESIETDYERRREGGYTEVHAIVWCYRSSGDIRKMFFTLEPVDHQYLIADFYELNW